MPDDLLDAGSALSATVPTPVPSSESKKRRRELSNAQRAEIRRHFYDNSDSKPTQKQLILWFKEKHYHTLTQSQVSKILSDQYTHLDDDKWLNKGKNIQADYPDLEAALYQWEIAANSSGRLTVTSDILQQMAARLWHQLPQYSDLKPPKFVARSRQAGVIDCGSTA
jgi:Fission yeast centromere protein N-terminal domain